MCMSLYRVDLFHPDLDNIPFSYPDYENFDVFLHCLDASYPPVSVSYSCPDFDMSASNLCHVFFDSFSEYLYFHPNARQCNGLILDLKRPRLQVIVFSMENDITQQLSLKFSSVIYIVK